MSTVDQKVAQFLTTMGYSPQFQLVPGPENFRFTIINHLGVNMAVVLDREIYLWVEAGIGYVPKVNVAPLFRKLLELQGLMGGVYFSISPTDDNIKMMVSRQIEGLDFVELKSMLDTIGANYWQNVSAVIQQFQIPAKPA